jgi:hypothetical protein
MEELGCAGASTARIRGRRRSSAAQKQNPAEPAGAAQKQSRSTTLCIAPVERIVSDFRSAVLCACWAVGGQPAAAVCTVHSLSDCCCCALQERAVAAGVARWRLLAAAACIWAWACWLAPRSRQPPPGPRPQAASSVLPVDPTVPSQIDRTQHTAAHGRSQSFRWAGSVLLPADRSSSRIGASAPWTA